MAQTTVILSTVTRLRTVDSLRGKQGPRRTLLLLILDPATQISGSRACWRSACAHYL